MKSHRDLKVWQNATDLVVKFYQAAKDFPKTERFGLTSQLQRARSQFLRTLLKGELGTTPKSSLSS